MFNLSRLDIEIALRRLLGWFYQLGIIGRGSVATKFRRLSNHTLASLILAVILSSVAWRSAWADDPAPRPQTSDTGPLGLMLPWANSASCWLITDCARFDDLNLNISTLGAMHSYDGAGQSALAGQVRVSITALELLEVGAAFGGYTNHDDQGDVHGHTSTARVFAKLRLWPPPWVPVSSGLRVAASYQRTLTAGKVGLEELPGVDTDAVELHFARAIKRLDIDLGLGALWFELPAGWQAKAKVDLTVSVAMLGGEGPMSHTDRSHLFLQILYRFDVRQITSPLNDGYAIGGLDFRGGTGYRGAIGGGAQLVGMRAGFLALMMYQFTWGKGVRNPISERLAGKFSGTPDIVWKILGALDPVLGAEGCVYSDPKPEQPSFKMFCIGSPDPKDPSQILLPSGKRVPVGTHLWIYGRKLVLNDGTAVAEIPWLSYLRDKAGNAVEELGHCLKTYGAEALVMAGNVAAGCAMGGIEGVVPFSDGLALPSFYAPGRDFKISEGICETATAALSLLVGWGELNATLRGGAIVAPHLALAMGRGTMTARSTAATFELVNQCAKTGYLLANGSNIGSGIKKVEEAATRAPEQSSNDSNERPWKEGAYHGPKPEYENPGHHDPSSGNFRGRGSTTTPLPSDAEEVYKNAIPELGGRTWWGRNQHREYYRFQNSNGMVHFNGREKSERGLQVPAYVKKRFNGR